MVVTWLMSDGRNDGNDQQAETGAGAGSDTANNEDYATSLGKPGKRHQAYRDLAERYASGAAIPLPTFLKGQARREHVRACILEDHAERIDRQQQGTLEKFEELEGDLYKFFRGTALGFYRDMAGMDAARPKVMLLGDVHPGNFGVMPNRDNVPIFSVNDFDEVAYGPYTWDLKRGATGFVLGAKTRSGIGRKKRRKIAKCFAKGYIEGMKHYANGGNPRDDVFRMDNAPGIICDLFDEAMENRSSWLEDDHQDETRKGFRPGSQIEPVSSRLEEFQGHLDTLVDRNEIEPGGRLGELKVKDVARIYGKGCASLGLTRYHIMIEGPEKDGTDDIIVEFKRARRSALEGLAPHGGLDAGKFGDRIAEGQRIHIPNGDVFYGAVEIDGIPYMTRERAPFRDDIDQDELDYDDWRDYAHACGRALAMAHARSDDVGAIDYDIEPAILEDIEPQHLFIHDIACFAEEALDRMKRDWKGYRKDFKRGAFTRRLETYE